MVVNEHEKISNFTLRRKLKLRNNTTFHRYTCVFNNEHNVFIYDGTSCN